MSVTKARAVAGYTKAVDWVPSMAFDVLLFDALANYERLAYVPTMLAREYGTMAKKLGFKMLVA